MTQLKEAKKGKITEEVEIVAKNENITISKLVNLIANGKVVIPKNINGTSEPCGIGQELTTKINANIGSSSKMEDIDLEVDETLIIELYSK